MRVHAEDGEDRTRLDDNFKRLVALGVFQTEYLGRQNEVASRADGGVFCNAFDDAENQGVPITQGSPPSHSRRAQYFSWALRRHPKTLSAKFVAAGVGSVH